ncbi:unnamed protein product [Paramecium sonneborni]|uniref:Uncharacterized protein n=1 Tax=Paramecium sonneborni TaxID=65129 RepID=A0A8S1NP38_9CILI|nr:unnamed protein product [Paramecium sonneborni]
MTTKKILINIIQTSNDLTTKKKIETNQQTELKQEIQRPLVSAFDDYKFQRKNDWIEYYEKQLQEDKQLHPNATHNELTSLISKKWKKAKKNVKYFDQLAQQIKMELINKETDSILNKDDDLQIIQKNQESDQIIEKLRQSSLKLIFRNIVLELKGQIVLDAVNENRLIIYINNEQENEDTKNEDSNKCSQSINDEQKLDKEQEENEDDNINIVNNIKDYL